MTYLICSVVLTQFTGLLLNANMWLSYTNNRLLALSKNLYPPLKELRELMVYHYKICHYCKRLNATFSVQLLLIIFRISVEFFSSLHSLVTTKTRSLVMDDFF